MASLTTKEMAQPIPDQIDWTKVIEIACGLLTGLIAWIYFVNWYFKNKSQEKREWIENIARVAVKAAMDESFKDVNKKIDTLFTLREEDRKHIDHKFDSMMTEIRK